MKFRIAVCLSALLGFGLSNNAGAVAVLTPYAVTQGYRLSTFVDQIPNNVAGPIGILPISGLNIMISGFASGEVRVFKDIDNQHWTNSISSAGGYGANGPAGLTEVNGKYYLAKQAGSQVVQINADGSLNQVLYNGPVNATGLIPSSTAGHLLISNGYSILDLNIATQVLTTFVNQPTDGIVLSPDGQTVYGAIGGHILGFNMTTKAQVFDSGVISGWPDGVSIGAGTLSGNLFVNTNLGQLIQVNIANPAVQNILVTGGSRGDFVASDLNNGSMLFTQTDSVLRLTAPPGGGFGAVCQ